MFCILCRSKTCFHLLLIKIYSPVQGPENIIELCFDTVEDELIDDYSFLIIILYNMTQWMISMCREIKSLFMGYISTKIYWVINEAINHNNTITQYKISEWCEISNVLSLKNLNKQTTRYLCEDIADHRFLIILQLALTTSVQFGCFMC